MQVKKQQLEPDMEQWTGSKLGKEYVNEADFFFLEFSRFLCDPMHVGNLISYSSAFSKSS